MLKSLFAPVVEEILKPIMTRFGTAIGAFLLTLGATTHEVDTIVAGALAAAGLGLDLVLERRRVRAVAAKVRKELDDVSSR